MPADTPCQAEHSWRLRLVKRPASEVLQAAAPTGMEGWVSSLAREHEDPDAPTFAIDLEGEGIVGQAGLAVRRLRSGKGIAWVTVAVFDPKHRGRGIGTVVMRKLLAYGFAVLDVSVVRVRADQDNAAALRCYRKAGFVVSSGREDGSVHMEAQRNRWLKSHGSEARGLADRIGRWVDVGQ